jgi:MoaA/NifB/PqqE/SkfB family radical SAM enzyme
MNIPHDSFCVLPWLSLEASPIGTVRPCCLALEEIKDNNGDKFKLQTSTFIEIQNSDHMKKLRAEFLEGKKPQTCKRCWDEERSGRTSKRMHTLDRLKGMVDHNISWSADAKPLLFLDLKLGNICNLKCRICGSWSSSTYAAEDLNFFTTPELKKSSFSYQMLKDGAWPRENSQFWSELENTLTDIRYIEFTGGEPFMIQEHFDLLKRLVEKGLAGQIEIHYNTNGTQWPEGAEEIWKHFKNVEIAFSIDDVGERFEYQRSNAIWEEVQNNIARFIALRHKLSNIRLQICCTVNVFNVYYLNDVAQWIYGLTFDFVYWNVLHDQFYFSIGTLPTPAKQAIERHLRSQTWPEKCLPEIEGIIDFMNKGNSLDGELLKSHAKELDFKRNQNLSTVAPEFAELIGYNINE